jgi:hypothetical protein
MSFKRDFKHAMKESELTPFGLIIGAGAVIISGTWVVFIPIALIIGIYYIVKDIASNNFVAGILAYYLTSVVMSIMGLLIHYLPNYIGGGLFETGYILADYLTLNSIIDWIIKIQTDSWGIVYNWIILSSAVLATIVLTINRNIKKRLKKQNKF